MGYNWGGTLRGPRGKPPEAVEFYGILVQNHCLYLHNFTIIINIYTFLIFKFFLFSIIALMILGPPGSRAWVQDQVALWCYKSGTVKEVL